MLLPSVDRVGNRLVGRESRDVRELKLSEWRTGERPETSCVRYQFAVALRQDIVLTKDLLYDSKDSREMVNASASLKHSRWLVLVVEGDLVDQNDGLSVGDGCCIC